MTSPHQLTLFENRTCTVLTQEEAWWALLGRASRWLLWSLIRNIGLGVKISHGHNYTSCATLGHFEVEHVDLMLRYNVHYIGSLSGPFWCQNAQSETNSGGRHAKEAGNLAFSGGKRWWSGLKLSQNNPSPLAIISTRFHSLGPPALCAIMQNAIVRVKGCQVSVRGWKKRDRVAIWQVNKTHRQQSSILGLVTSSPIRSAFSHYCWGRSGLPGSGLPSLYCRGRSGRPYRTTAEEDRNGQDLVCLHSLLLGLMRQSRSSSAVTRTGRPHQTQQ